MTQQSYFWAYIQRKWKQDIEEISVLPIHCRIIHNSQDMEKNLSVYW